MEYKNVHRVLKCFYYAKCVQGICIIDCHSFWFIIYHLMPLNVLLDEAKFRSQIWRNKFDVIYIYILTLVFVSDAFFTSTHLHNINVKEFVLSNIFYIDNGVFPKWSRLFIEFKENSNKQRIKGNHAFIQF